MDVRLLAASAAFALVSSITPGPNNLMLASSGLAFGFRRTLPLLLGVQAGFQCLLLAVAAGLGAVFQRHIEVQWALKCIGAGYLLYLAQALWRSGSTGAAALDRPIGFSQAAAFQVFNPKAWMMCVSAVGAYTLAGPGYWCSVWILVALFFVLGLPSITLWAVFGSGFRAAFQNRETARRVGRALAVVTGASCLLVLL